MLSTHTRHSPGFATGNTVTAKVSMSAPPSLMAGSSLWLPRHWPDRPCPGHVETRWSPGDDGTGLLAPEGVQETGGRIVSADQTMPATARALARLMRPGAVASPLGTGRTPYPRHPRLVPLINGADLSPPPHPSRPPRPAAGRPRRSRCG